MATSSYASKPRLVTIARTPLPPGFTSPPVYGHEYNEDQTEVEVDDYEKEEIERLRKGIEKIQEQYEGGEKHEDLGFMTHNKYPVDESFYQWSRPEDIKETMMYLGENFIWTTLHNPSPEDVNQGKLPNCWLVNAISLIAGRPSLIKRVLVTDSFNPHGIYGVRLFQGGLWLGLIIDDQFPCDKSNNPIGTMAKNQQLWPMLIEKAAAKLLGNYRALESGSIGDGLKMLTGFCAEEFRTAAMSEDDMFKMLERELKCGSLIGFASGQGDMFQPSNEYGVQPQHVYSLLATYSYQDIRLLRIRNIHGKDYHDGAWGDESHAWYDIPVSCRPLAELGDQQAGIIWVDMDEFFSYFVSVTICYIRTNWNTDQIGLMLPVRTHTVFDATEIIVQEFTKIHIYLDQQQPRNRANGDVEVVLVAFDLEWRVITHIPCRYCNNVTWTELLGPGTFRILCLSFAEWKTNERIKYALVCDSSRRVKIHERKMSMGLLKSILIGLAKQRGETVQLEDSSSLMKCYTIRPSDWCGVIFVAINEHPSRYLHVSTCSNWSKHIQYTRNSTGTTDIIPPKRGQVLNILTISCEEIDSGGFGEQIILGQSYQRTEALLGNNNNIPEDDSEQILHDLAPTGRFF